MSLLVPEGTALKDFCPGIKEAVRWFNDRGWKTCDSGDGSNFQKGMEGALEVPMVVVAPSVGDNMVHYAQALLKQLEEVGAGGLDIQATYNPRDRSALLLISDVNKTGDFQKLK